MKIFILFLLIKDVIALNWAFVTLISEDTEVPYSKLACVLGNQLKEYYPNIPRIAIVSHSNLTVNYTKKCQWEILKVKNIYPSYQPKSIGYGPYKDSFTRFHAWTLIKYDRIVYLDADSFFMNKIDFEIEIKRKNTLISCPTIWSKIIKGRPITLNSNLLILTPSIETYNKLIFMKHKPTHFIKNYKQDLHWFEIIDMGPLMQVFPNWSIPIDVANYCSEIQDCCITEECKPTAFKARPGALVHQLKPEYINNNWHTSQLTKVFPDRGFNIVCVKAYMNYLLELLIKYT